MHSRIKMAQDTKARMVGLGSPYLCLKNDSSSLPSFSISWTMSDCVTMKGDDSSTQLRSNE